MWHKAYMVICGMLLLGGVVSAQVLKPVDREHLDAMVNPALSTKAAGTINSDCATLEVGTISDTEECDVRFVVRNTTTSKIAITELRTSCSCLKPMTRPLVIESGEQATIEATFNPAGRNGKFSYNIDLYTSLDESHPTERLTLVGSVKRSDEWAHLPESMGQLRLSRRSVTIEGQGSERIAMANSGTTPLRLTATSDVEHLRLYSIPEVIAPHSEGDIIVEYRGSAMELNTTIIVEGIDASAPQRTIRVTIKR